MWFVVWHYPFVNIDYEHDSQWPLLYAISQTSCASWCIHVVRTKDIPEPHCWLGATGALAHGKLPRVKRWSLSRIGNISHMFPVNIACSFEVLKEVLPLYAIITSLDFCSNFGRVWNQKRRKNCVWKEAEQGQLSANTCTKCSTIENLQIARGVKLDAKKRHAECSSACASTNDIKSPLRSGQENIDSMESQPTSHTWMLHSFNLECF